MQRGRRDDNNFATSPVSAPPSDFAAVAVEDSLVLIRHFVLFMRRLLLFVRLRVQDDE